VIEILYFFNIILYAIEAQYFSVQYKIEVLGRLSLMLTVFRIHRKSRSNAKIYFYHKEVLEVFLVYNFCLTIGFGTFEELLLLELPADEPLDLLFIHGTSIPPLAVETWDVDPLSEGLDIFFCSILSSWVSEHDLFWDSDNSFFLPRRSLPLTQIGLLFPDPSFLPARCALLALVIQK